MSGFECYDLKWNASNELLGQIENFMLYVNKRLFDESHGTKTII